jgi:hypothetical protein
MLQAVFTLQYKGSADVTLCIRTAAIFKNNLVSLAFVRLREWIKQSTDKMLHVLSSC